MVAAHAACSWAAGELNGGIAHRFGASAAGGMASALPPCPGLCRHPRVPGTGLWLPGAWPDHRSGPKARDERGTELTVRRQYGTVLFLIPPSERAQQSSVEPMASSTSPPRERILSAARALFFQHGFASVSTDDLAQAAFVSKATLYRLFQGMNGVLRAVVEAEVEAFEQGLPVAVESQDDFCEALIWFGSRLLNFLNQPEIIKFSQLMFEEARSQPDLAHDFYSCSYGRTQADLSHLIQQGIDLGFLMATQSASELAEQLLGLWEGFAFIRALLGLTTKPFDQPEAWSRTCVHTLLQGHGREEKHWESRKPTALVG